VLRSAGTTAGPGGRATAYAVAVVVALALPGVASAASPASTGGAAQPAPTPSPDPQSTDATTTDPAAARLGATPFGVPRTRPPRLRNVRCLTGCADARTPLTGARLRIRGRDLRRTDMVLFRNAAGDADDVAARPLRRARGAVDVRVPLGARSGQLSVVDRDGIGAAAPIELAVASGGAAAPRMLVAAGPQVEVQVAGPRGFFDSAIAPHVNYVLHGGAPAAVTIEVVRESDGTVVASWPGGLVNPESPQTAAWDGLSGGKLQRAGRYAFRIRAQLPGVPQANTSQAAAPVAGTADDPGSFMFLRNVFPVRGPHYYGEGPARFGGGRGHQGQDVFATCGTPVVAARGGTVQYRGYQSAAGNYLVINGARTGVDYGYMHLRTTALVAEGERVRTGQLIGYVGDTGDASACHLHFELWTAPGWYDGGAPYDPLPSLRSWDRRS
jgi:murein DD-endopeptidase MepM/ murein hydrolase activator NlpD